MIWFWLLLGLYIYATYEYYALTVRNINLREFQRYHKVPDCFKDKKIVFASDLQFDHPIVGFDHFAMSQLVKKINKQDPDLLIIGGDIIHGKNRHNHHVFTYLDEIKAEKIMIIGNHDYHDIATVINFSNHHQVKIIKNETYIWHGIQIIAVDDYKCGHPQLPDIDSMYSILLSHNPDYLEKVNVEGIELSLSGHFHAGQITFFGQYAPAIRSEVGQKYRYGFVKNAKFDSYVTSGVGGKVFIFPLRFFARPEIVVLEYK